MKVLGIQISWKGRKQTYEEKLGSQEVHSFPIHEQEENPQNYSTVQDKPPIQT